MQDSNGTVEVRIRNIQAGKSMTQPNVNGLTLQIMYH